MEPQPTTDSTNCSEDYSDMPRLIPFHQMETEGSSPSADEASFMAKTPTPDNVVLKTNEVDLVKEKEKISEQDCEIVAISQEKTKEGTVIDDVPKIAITPAINVTDLVEQLMAHMDPQQRKQFASAIQSKVAVDDITAVNSNTVSVTNTTTNADVVTSITAVATPNVNSVDTAYGCDKATESKESEHVVVHTKFVSTSKEQLNEEQNMECQSSEPKSGMLTMKRKTRKRKVEGCSEPISGKPVRKMKWREVRLRSNDVVKGCSNDDVVAGGNRNVDSLRREMQISVSPINLEPGVQTEEKQCKGRMNEEQRKKFVVGKKPSRKLEKRNMLEEELCDGHQKYVVDVATGETGEHSENSDENTVDHIKGFHLDMKRKVNEQLKVVIEQVRKQFANLELSLGSRKQWNLPWYRLNWKEVTRRFAI